ncbi:hypothetical protein DERP_006717 [Dermatophagoides pteronyssinus]|uniref:Uncharacterized protein n=1 Tax=Dermatophagoides pteronyssinus TaxID=6956 RepID=A0ABQ8IRT5_DERPT|nr:hypothetical protein DERP_006717 [Dermatophagoides pteronyssinus]
MAPLNGLIDSTILKSEHQFLAFIYTFIHSLAEVLSILRQRHHYQIHFSNLQHFEPLFHFIQYGTNPNRFFQLIICSIFCKTSPQFNTLKQLNSGKKDVSNRLLRTNH